MLKFLQKNFKGGYSIPLFGIYLNIPKLAPLMTGAFIIAAIGRTYDITLITFLGEALIVLAIICFFLPRAKLEE